MDAPIRTTWLGGKHVLEKVELECWVGKRIEVHQGVKKKKRKEIILGFKNMRFAIKGKGSKEVRRLVRPLQSSW